MARLARVVAVGEPHHITQRGNNRQDVFRCDADRVRYLELLKLHADQWGIELLGYCLMDNHVHLVATAATIAIVCPRHRSRTLSLHSRVQPAQPT